MSSLRSEDETSTSGMVDYDRNSIMQRSLVESHAQQLRRVVGEIGPLDGEFRIVDYGCGPGQSAIEAVRPAIEAYRAGCPQGPIAVCHADQPGNDWNALFALAMGPTGYHGEDPAIRTEAAVGSFYERMAPEDSVTLATSFTAVHWLRRALHRHTPGAIWFADLD
ncbi:MAG: hypothetical protein AAFX81_21685, partial [Pseudomonadota bacterium]